MGGPDSAFVGVAQAGDGSTSGPLKHAAEAAGARASISSNPLSTESGISSKSTFSDEGITSTGEHVQYRIKDFRHKIYNKSIVVERGFEPKEGLQIAPGLVIHKFLAGGFQGGVYEMADDDGNVREDCLLKVLKKSAVLGDLEKEWAIGQALNVLANKNGYLVGFMKTYEALRVEGEDGIRGMLIERLNGQLVAHVVSDHKFSDALYLRDLIYQMSLALFRAETVLGFKHADLRLTNIMEHYPDPNNPEAREFKIIDFGLASIQERTDSKLYKRLQKSVFSKLTHPEALGKMFLKSINPANHASILGEAVYKVAWIKHNDIYHVLASLSHFTDDRTWPEEHKEVVEQFADLMKDVTGIKLRLKFLPQQELDARKADKETEVQKMSYKVNHAFADLKHFGQRFGSQASLMNNSDIPPQDVLEHPLFKEHTSCCLGVPYHNAECEDVALFSKMEMLRGRSRLLPDDVSAASVTTDGSSVGSDDEDDDSVAQSWARPKPLTANVARNAAVGPSDIAGVSSNGMDSRAISAPPVHPGSTSTPAATASTVGTHSRASSSSSAPGGLGSGVQGQPGSRPSASSRCGGRGVCALATRLASTMGLDGVDVSEAAEGLDADVLLANAAAATGPKRPQQLQARSAKGSARCTLCPWRRRPTAHSCEQLPLGPYAPGPMSGRQKQRPLRLCREGGVWAAPGRDTALACVAITW